MNALPNTGGSHLGDAMAGGSPTLGERKVLADTKPNPGGVDEGNGGSELFFTNLDSLGSFETGNTRNGGTAVGTENVSLIGVDTPPTSSDERSGPVLDAWNTT